MKPRLFLAYTFFIVIFNEYHEVMGLRSNEDKSDEFVSKEQFDALEKIVLDLRNEIETIHSDRKARLVELEEDTIKRKVRNKGCPNNLPSVMSKNPGCKRLKLSCTKLKNKCNSKLGAALDNSNSAKICKNALKGNAQKRVDKFCQETCNKCVEGNWGSWSSYGKCQCFQKRTRVCDNPKPSGGAASCSGLKSQKTECGDCMVTDLKENIDELTTDLATTKSTLRSLLYACGAAEYTTTAGVEYHC